MRKFVIAATLLGMSFGPVFAQTMTPRNELKPAGEELTRADCQANFRTADADGNGVISIEEAEASPGIIPTALGLSGPITQAEFMAACTANLPKGG